MCRNKYSTKFSELAQVSTLHGIQHIANSDKSILSRVLWTLTFFLMFATYSYFLSNTLIKYFSYSTMTSIEFKTTTKLEFPSVTICNSNIAKRSAVFANKDAHYVFYHLNEPYLNHGFPQPEHVDETSINMSKVYNEVAHQAKDMYFRGVEFDGQLNRKIEEQQTTSVTPLGLCHTFNSPKIRQRYGKINTTRPGEKYGFIFAINLEDDEKFHTSTNASGAIVLVHSIYQVPEIAEKGFLISAGMETYASIKLTKVTRLGGVYAKGEDQCYDLKSETFKNPLEYSRFYSRSACTRECRAKYQLKKCGCIDYLLGIPSPLLKICSFKDFKDCISIANEEFDADAGFELDCSCYHPCEEEIYDVTVSSAKYPHGFAADQLNKAFPGVLTPEFFENSGSALRIYFSEMQYTEVMEMPEYTPTTLFGELGGQLGLCLGASFLTLAEIVNLLHVVVQICIAKYKGPISDNSKPIKVAVVAAEKEKQKAWAIDN